MDRRWIAAWLVALVAVAGAAFAFETFLRSRHYVPTVQDDQDLWSLQADLITRDGGGVALLGASRIQFAVDPAQVAQATGRTAAMLAVNGHYPIAALRWLAEDPSFHGVAIIGIDARGLSKRHWEMQQPWIDHYEDRWTTARKIHRVLLTPLQQQLVFMRSPFALAALVRRQLAGLGLPFNDYVVLRSDRLGLIDYRRTDIEAIKRQRIVDLVQYYKDYPPEPPAEWVRNLQQVSVWVRAIQARGGQVVLFREPSGGEHLALDEKNYPRGLYWDAYARVSPAVMIDFRDEPSLAAIPLPDTSHIDGADVPRFTATLLAVLARRGIIALR
jgi:hypothetical protein